MAWLQRTCGRCRSSHIGAMEHRQVQGPRSDGGGIVQERSCVVCMETCKGCTHGSQTGRFCHFPLLRCHLAAVRHLAAVPCALTVVPCAYLWYCRFCMNNMASQPASLMFLVILHLPPPVHRALTTHAHTTHTHTPPRVNRLPILPPSLLSIPTAHSFTTPLQNTLQYMWRIYPMLGPVPERTPACTHHMRTVALT